MRSATIFYNNRLFLNRDPDCFDWRSEAGILPAGSVPTGFITEESEAIDPLHSNTPRMAKAYAAVCAEAREYVEDI